MYKIEDLTIWNNIINVSAMGMGSPSQQRKSKEQTELLKTRQRMILKHMNDSTLQKFIDHNNDIKHRMSLLKEEMKEVNNEIESYLKKENDEEYAPYITTDVYKMTYKDYLKQLSIYQ